MLSTGPIYNTGKYWHSKGDEDKTESDVFIMPITEHESSQNDDNTKLLTVLS